MGGLSAAIYGRLAGFDVLVLERSAQAGGKAAGITVGEYQLDPGPSIIILPKIYEAVFTAAGRKMADYLQFQRLETLSRVFFGSQAPLDLPANELDACRILNDISKKDSCNLRSLLQKIEKVEPYLDRTVYDHPFVSPTQLLDLNLLKFGMGFNPTQTYKEQVDRMFESHLMRAFFYGFPSYGGQTYWAKSPGAFLIPYYMLREGVYFPIGGVRAIPAAFERLARELGVEFQFNADVDSVQTDDRVIRSVTLKDGSIINADAFISNVDRFTFSGWLGQPVQSEPSFSYFTVHWGVREVLPKLDHHNLFIPDNFQIGFEELYQDGQFPQKPIVYVNSTTALDSKAAPRGSSNVFSVVTSPSKTSRMDWKDKEIEFTGRVSNALAEGGVSWDPNDVDFIRVQTPSYFESAHGNYRGSLYGLEDKHRQWGIFPASNKDQKYLNLAYAGGSVQPGAGLPMVTLSGKFAVGLLHSN